MIIINNIVKRYGDNLLLDDVSLQIGKGEIFGLLGSNGAGKSTLISILATVLQPSSGNIRINGLDLKKQTKQVRQLIGFVPQDIALWDEFTVKENLRFWSKFVNGKVTEERLLELCDAVQLEDKWDERVSSLSGGMKRKLNIAVSLIHDPDILLMDEPTVGIDLQSKLEINQYVKRLAEQGKTIVYITHDMSEIVKLCDRIGVLQKGVMKFTGTLKQAAESFREMGYYNIGIEEVVYRLLRKTFDTVS
ncbi:ABC transporter ATP-binding protein [Peribacillus sp. NPDC097284]|uniref:ABC transporter ATP-binding protein n=1 Tax=Peribacillus sp. NPDC097284 TaxID=3364401 RepID=UPI00382572D8